MGLFTRNIAREESATSDDKLVEVKSLAVEAQGLAETENKAYIASAQYFATEAASADARRLVATELLAALPVSEDV